MNEQPRRKSLEDFIHLTPPQSQVLRIFHDDPVLRDHFYFTGGTLLKALGIVPRESNDLDFFTFPEVDPMTFTGLVSHAHGLLIDIFGAKNLVNAPKGFIHQESGMIIEFISDQIGSIAVGESYGELKISSLEDLAANKASALCCRDEIKDLIDVAFLTRHQGWKIADLARFAEQKFQIGTISEEKIFEELSAKWEMFEIPAEIFLADGAQHQHFVEQQVQELLQSFQL